MQRFISSIHSLLLIVVLVGASYFLAFAADGQIKIAQTASTTFPIIINKAGSYVLTSNLVVDYPPSKNAMEITANDVTVDLNGHKIQGPGTGSGCGIYAEDRYNITIKNGRIWGFGLQGIRLASSVSDNHNSKGAGHLIEGVQVVNNYEGIVINGGVVKNCVANNNKLNCGICVYNSLVTNCIANKNVGSGILANKSTVINNTATYNDSIGIQAVDECYIAGNNLRNNTGYGLRLSLDGANYAIKNVASDSGIQNYYIPPITPTGNYQPYIGDNANYGF